MRATIESMLNNGFGLTRTQAGQVIFVADTLPGEVVELNENLFQKRKGVLWAQEHHRVHPSSLRTQPSCPHFQACGGCSTLHIKPNNELKLKSTLILDVLKRIGKWAYPNLVGIDFPQNGSRFRGKLHADGRHLGWKAAKTHRVIPIRHCHVLPQSFRQLLEPLTRTVVDAKFKGAIFFAVHPKNSNTILSFHGNTPHSKLLAKLYQAETAIAGLNLCNPRGHLWRQWGDKQLNFHWPPFIVDLKAEQFFQSNPKSWPVFHTILQAYLTRFQPHRIWDVHAGSGFLTSGLAGKEVFATEPDPAAFAQLKANLMRLNWSHQIYPGPAAEALTRMQWGKMLFDGMVLDPPRTGLEKPFRAWLIQAGPPSMLYFSCDFATFARDVAHLGDTYQSSGALQILNVNPGTLRVELAATLVRRESYQEKHPVQS